MKTQDLHIRTISDLFPALFIAFLFVLVTPAIASAETRDDPAGSYGETCSGCQWITSSPGSS